MRLERRRILADRGHRRGARAQSRTRSLERRHERRRVGTLGQDDPREPAKIVPACGDRGRTEAGDDDAETDPRSPAPLAQVPAASRPSARGPQSDTKSDICRSRERDPQLHALGLAALSPLALHACLAGKQRAGRACCETAAMPSLAWRSWP